jgi:hypothetical protein
MKGHFELNEPSNPIYTSKVKIKATNSLNDVMELISDRILSYNTEEHTLNLIFCPNKGQAIKLLQQCKDTKNLSIIHNEIEYRFCISYKSIVNINNNIQQSLDIMLLTVVYNLYSLSLIEDGVEIKLK